MFSARSITVAVAFCVIVDPGILAQVTTAVIVGRVTDARGAVLPGAVAENVTVTAESPLVQTDSSTLSSLVTEKTSSGNSIPRQMQFAVKLLF